MLLNFCFYSTLMRVIDDDTTPKQLKCSINKSVKNTQRERVRENLRTRKKRKETPTDRDELGIFSMRFDSANFN